MKLPTSLRGLKSIYQGVRRKSLHSVRAPAIGLIKRRKSARVNPPGHRIPDDDQNVGVGDPRFALVQEHLKEVNPSHVNHVGGEDKLDHNLAVTKR